MLRIVSSGEQVTSFFLEYSIHIFPTKSDEEMVVIRWGGGSHQTVDGWRGWGRLLILKISS